LDAPTEILLLNATAFSVLLVGVGIVAVIGLAVLVLRLVDRFTLGPSMTPEERADNERLFQERLHRPKWGELEDHFGFAMPEALRELYTDLSRLNRNSFYVVPPHSTDKEDQHFIARFEPADMQTLADVWFLIGDNRFPLASDDFGNYFYVELAPESHDAPVFFVDHDGGDVSLVADSVKELLNWEI
jgi:hypothetical protein